MSPPLFSTVCIVFTDTRWLTFCNMFFLSRFLGILSSASSYADLFNEARACRWILVGRQNLCVADFLTCVMTPQRHYSSGHFKTKFGLFVDLSRRDVTSEIPLVTVHFRLTPCWTKICSQGWSWWSMKWKDRHLHSCYCWLCIRTCVYSTVVTRNKYCRRLLC